MSTISSLGSNSLQPTDYAQLQQNLFNKAVTGWAKPAR